MKRELIRRGYTAEVRAEDKEDGNIIAGRPIIYNSETDICGLFKEVIAPGALDGADLSDVRFCKNHDTSNVYARSRNGNENSTMKILTDADGLLIEAALDKAGNPLAATLYSEVSRGDISGMSFMFSIEDETWSNEDTDYPTRTINKIGSVIEVSAVTLPAYEETYINARDSEVAEAAKRALEKVKKTCENREAEAFNKKLALEKEKIKIYL